MCYHNNNTKPASCPGHTLRRTHTNSSSPRHYVLWLANWLANRLWLWRNLAGRNWKMGSPLFSLLGWTKDQRFFPPLKQYEEVEYKVSKWLNTYHRVYMLVSSGMTVVLAQYMTAGTEWGTCHTYLCWVIFICEGSGRRRGLKWFVKNVVPTLHSTD